MKQIPQLSVCLYHTTFCVFIPYNFLCVHTIQLSVCLYRTLTSCTHYILYMFIPYNFLFFITYLNNKALLLELRRWLNWSWFLKMFANHNLVFRNWCSSPFCSQTTARSSWWEDDLSLRGEWKSFTLDAGGPFVLISLTTARHRSASRLQPPSTLLPKCSNAWAVPLSWGPRPGLYFTQYGFHASC